MRSILMTQSLFKYETVKSPETFLIQAETILKQRGSQYGDCFELFERMATRFGYTLGEKVTPYQAARIMIELKLARLDLNPYSEDSIIDIINYTALAGAMQSYQDVKDAGKEPRKRVALKDIDFQEILNSKPSDVE